MKSYFISGTDTDVGKTVVTAGFARSFRTLGVDVGVMKPFAAGTPQEKGFKSKDVEFLATAAQVNDDEKLMNPQFFSVPASPYTVSQSLGVNVDVELVLNNFKKLSNIHDMVLVEGMGGIMTPILKNYFVTDLIKDLKLDAIIVTRSRIGTINHTIMTCKMCKMWNIPIRGIVINYIDDGYPPSELERDLQELLNIPILGSIPHMKDLNLNELSKHIESKFDLKSLLD